MKTNIFCLRNNSKIPQAPSSGEEKKMATLIFMFHFEKLAFLKNRNGFLTHTDRHNTHTHTHTHPPWGWRCASGGSESSWQPQGTAQWSGGCRNSSGQTTKRRTERVCTFFLHIFAQFFATLHIFLHISVQFFGNFVGKFVWTWRWIILLDSINPFLHDGKTFFSQIFKNFLCYFLIFKTWTWLLCQIHILFYTEKH